VACTAMVLLTTITAKAQVSAYTFSQASGTYTPITGGTLVASGTTDDSNFLVALPFTFTYNGTNYNNIRVCSNGWASFTNTAGGNYGPLTVAGNMMSILGRDLQGNTLGNIRAQQVGAEFVIQWADYRRFGAALGTQNFNFQIRLQQTTNVIRFQYGTMTASATNADYDCGLNGATAADFICRTTTTNWTASTAGVTNTANMSLSPSVFPPNGHTYIWTPSSCSAPGGLVAAVTGGGTSANISWNAAAPVPSGGYQFAVQTSPVAPGVGTPFGGLSTSLGGLTANTQYYLFVRSDCGGGLFSGWASLPFFTGYCQPTGTSANSQITNVLMNGVTTLNNASGSNAGYGNFTGVTPTVSQAAGLAVNFTITHTSDPGITIWIDWNNDLVFQIGERVYNSAGFVLNTVSGSFNVPVAQASGNYRMRVVADWNTGSPVQCPVNINGETEDYTFVVTAPPTCGVPTGLSASLNSTTSVNIGWNAPGSGTIVDYEYAVQTSAIPPASGTATSSTSVAGVSVLANTSYYLHVRTNCTSPVSSSGWSTFGPFFTGYCVPVSTFDPVTFGDYIANVTTTNGLVNFNNSTLAGTPFGYQNFSAISCSQIAGGSINFSVSTGGYAHNKRIWVDWDDDLVFEASELMFTSSAAAITHTGSFLVPVAQAVGNYRMRVRSVDGLNPIDPCITYGYTEAEDYTFNVATPPTCYPVTGLTITALGPTNVSFQWSAPVLGNPAVVYEWALTTSATPPAAGTATGTNNVLLTPHTPNAQNYIHVRVDCDPLNLGTDFSSWITLPFFSGYCASTATTFGSTYFTNFSTTGAVTNINNNSTFNGIAPTGYEDFTAVAASEYPGQDFAVQFTLFGGTAGVNIWVDWNNDLDFNDAGEFAVSSAGFIAAGTYNSVINVPLTQAIGSYRVRIRTDWNSGNPTACGNIAQGETEDYTLNVIAIPLCSAVLGSFATTYTTSSDLPLVCTGQTVNFLVAPVAPIAAGITYQLQFSANIGGPYATTVGPQAGADFSVASPATGFYRIQVLCSGSPLGGTTWTPAAVSISNPVITTTTPASRCGTGTLTLAATNAPPLSTITWYTQASGGVAIATGPSFTTPSLTATTTYFVQAENQVPTAQIGNGVTANANNIQTPFTSFWENSRLFILVRKSELQASGLAASDLTTLTFDVSSTGVFGQNNFQIRMAHTTAVNANLGFATPNSGFTTVFAPATVPPPALGLRTFSLIPSAFAWNGVDNLLIEICHESDATNSCPTCYGTNSGVRGSFLTFYSTYGRYQDNAAACGLDAGTVVLSNFRPNMRIGGQIALCNSPRIAVTATVNDAPNISVPSSQLFAPSVGNFNPIPLVASSALPATSVTILPAAAIYLDAATTGSYTAGDNANGVTQFYAPLATTTYTATATGTNGCTATGTYTITVDQSGIPASACAATLVTSYNNLTWFDVNTIGSAGGLGAP